MADLVVHREEDVFFRSRMPKTVHWSVSWSDLMMTMFILFVVMYIYKSADREFLSSEWVGGDLGSRVANAAGVKNGGRLLGDSPGSIEQPISKIYDMSKQTLKAKDLEYFASVDLVADKAVRIILTGDLLFDTGKADLKPEAIELLGEIASIIRQTTCMVNVVGHTDNVPIHSERFPTNWELSAIRACVVARFLIEDMKIPAKRFYVSGHSYYQSVKPNYTAKDRAANRRVEIIITKERPWGTPEGINDASDSSQMVEDFLSTADS